MHIDRPLDKKPYDRPDPSPEVVIFHHQNDNFVVKDLITQYFWDFIPILTILLFHKKNFGPVDDIEEEQVDNNNYNAHISRHLISNFQY